MKKIKLNCILLALIIFINFTLSLYKLGERTLSGDEARIAIKVIWILRGISNLIHWNFSKETLLSFYGIFTHTHAPIVLILPLPFLIFGINEFALRLPYAFISSCVIYFIYKVIKKELSQAYAFIISLFLASSSLLIGWARWLDYSILEILLAGMLTYFLFLFVKHKKAQYFYWLMVTYTVSLFTVISFYVFLPLLAFYIFKSWNKLNFQVKARGLAIPLLTAGLFYLIWFYITVFYLKGDLGLNYVLFHRLKMAGTLIETTKFFIESFLLDINIIIWIPFVFFGLRLFRKDKLVQVSALYCLIFIICFFILRSEAPYIYHIYLPLIFIGIKGLKLLNKKVVVITFSILATINMYLITLFLKGEMNISKLVWSFGYQKNSIKEAGLIVRNCLKPQDRYLTNEDYYITDYYFNRRYPTESDDNKWGREKSILRYQELNIKAIFLEKAYLIRHPDIQLFLDKQAVTKKQFFDFRVLYLMQDCFFPGTSSSEKSFDSQFGSIWKIIDFKR